MGAATFMEWNGTALLPLTARDPGAQTELRRNYAVNPSFDVDTFGYGAVVGAGGVATLTRNAGAGADGKPGFGRMLWTTAPTAGCGINVSTALIPAPIAIGDKWSVQAMVRISAARTLSFGTYARNGSSGSSGAGAKFNVPANVWTPLQITLQSSPIAGDNLYCYCYFDGAGNAPGAGDYMDLDLMMPERGDPTPYFDGSSTDTLSLGYKYLGAAGASASIEYDPNGGNFTAWIV